MPTAATAPVHRPPWAALLVLVLGLLLSAGAAQYVHQSLRTHAQQEFEARARMAAAVLQRRVDNWAEVLQGVRALFYSSDDISREEFQRHYQQLELPQRYPGFRALQFVRWVGAAEKAAYEAAVRADTSLQPLGYPNFAVHPPGERADYFITDYVEPLAGNEPAFGFDAGSTPERRASLERARDSGQLTASGRLALVQDAAAKAEVQAGYALRMPVYRPRAVLQTLAQRRAAFLGAAVVVLRVDEFIGAALDGAVLARLHLRVNDQGWLGQAVQPPAAANLLFDSAPQQRPARGAEQAPVHVAELMVGDRRWRLEFEDRAPRAFAAAPLLVAALGLLLSLLLFRLLWLQARAGAELAARVAARTAELAAANRALRTGEQRLELALTGAELGLWDWEIDTGRVAWNTQWRAQRGFGAHDPLEASVDSWRAQVHPDDLPAVQDALQAHLDGRSPAYAAEYRVRQREGGWRWVLDTGKVVERDAQGRPLRMAGTNLDITTRRQAEADRAAREAAEQASRAKSTFLARTSHELRTPLNAILGFAQMMRLDVAAPLPPAQAERLQRIEAAGEHLRGMIGEMLDLAGIEAGAVRLALSPVALAPLVAQCVATLEPQARAADVALHDGLREAGDASTVQADPTRLREILLNLLSNAVKYNRRGGWARVSARREGSCIRIDVEDAGAGLSDAQLEHLFEPFNRLGAEKTGIEGSGLGLVISHALAQLMRGSLQAARREAPPGGSVFTLRLPAADAAPGPVADVPCGPVDAASAAPPPPAAAEAPAPAVVLYVEDEPVNALLVQHVLALRPHCTLLLADCGADGLALARHRQPDLVLIDLNLPDMSGHEVLARLHHDAATRHLRCIALSADAMPESVAAARAAGFDDFWTKPIEVQSFLRALDAALAQRRPAVGPA